LSITLLQTGRGRERQEAVGRNGRDMEGREGRETGRKGKI